MSTLSPGDRVFFDNGSSPIEIFTVVELRDGWALNSDGFIYALRMCTRIDPAHAETLAGLLRGTADSASTRHGILTAEEIAAINMAIRVLK